jgi:hypothetical protein
MPHRRSPVGVFGWVSGLVSAYASGHVRTISGRASGLVRAVSGCVSGLVGAVSAYAGGLVGAVSGFSLRTWRYGRRSFEILLSVLSVLSLAQGLAGLLATPAVGSPYPGTATSGKHVCARGALLQRVLGMGTGFLLVDSGCGSGGLMGRRRRRPILPLTELAVTGGR